MNRGGSWLSSIVLGCAVITVTVAASVSSAVAAAALTTATASSAANGLKIAPVRSDITIAKGASQTVNLVVQNVTRSTVTLDDVVNDFVANADESGQPKLVLNSTELLSGTNFQTLIGPIAPLTLGPGQSTTVAVNLHVPINAASGGYYGAVRFAPASNTSTNDVALSGSVGSIFLVTVPGNLVEKLSIASFRVLHDGQVGPVFSSGPLTIESRFTNLGNIHVQPFGDIVLKNFSGTIIQRIDLNNTQPRGSVLPNSIRRFDYPIGVSHMFGKYTVEGSFGYGTTGQLLLTTTTFYVIPYKLIILIVVIVSLLIYLLRQTLRANKIRGQQGELEPQAETESAPAKAVKPTKRV